MKTASERDRLLLLAQCLSVDRSPSALAALRRSMQSDDVSWPELISFANHELLAPALWVALRDKELVSEPSDGTAEYLRRVHAVNRVRNDRRGLSRRALADAPLSGSLLAIEPGVRGLPKPAYGGF